MRNNKNISKVSIIMGSQSDYSTMKFCEKVLKILKISFEDFKDTASKAMLRRNMDFSSVESIFFDLYKKD